MRNKILKSKPLHITFDHKVHELYCKVQIAHPENYNYLESMEYMGIWDTGSEGCLISKNLAERLALP